MITLYGAEVLACTKCGRCYVKYEIRDLQTSKTQCDLTLDNTFMYLYVHFFSTSVPNYFGILSPVQLYSPCHQLEQTMDVREA